MYSHQQNIGSIVVLLAVVALLVLRNSRPQKMTVSRFWILPAIVVFLTIFVIVSTAAVEPGVLLAGGIASVIGIALGIPLGLARGHHSKVRLGDRPGTLYVDPSLVVTLIWLGAFAVRYAVRSFLPNAGSIALGATDGLLLFAVTSVIVARIVIFRKYEALRANQPVSDT
jgi:hypothetical protein